LDFLEERLLEERLDFLDERLLERLLFSCLYTLEAAFMILPEYFPVFARFFTIAFIFFKADGNFLEDLCILCYFKFK